MASTQVQEHDAAKVEAKSLKAEYLSERASFTCDHIDLSLMNLCDWNLLDTVPAGMEACFVPPVDIF